MWPSRETNSKKVVMARAEREPDFLRSLGRFSDDPPERDEQGSQVVPLLLGLVQATEKRRELAFGDLLSVGDGPGQLVDPVLEAHALGLELERPRIALGQGRLDLFSRQAGACVAGIQERANSLHEVEVVGRHERADYVRRKAGEL
jgi:hypothetical protein